MKSFIQIILNGNLPDALLPVFFGARLIALKKKCGGIRPIAVSNTLRRLASKVVCHKARFLTEHLPQQLGFAIRSGAESAVHATRRFISQSNENAILKIDFRWILGQACRDT